MRATVWQIAAFQRDGTGYDRGDEVYVVKIAVRVAIIVLVVAFAVFSLVGNPFRGKPAKIEAVCQANGYTAECTFTNLGGRTGTACAVVVVRGQGVTAESSRVCSGELGAHVSGQPVRAAFLNHAAVDKACADPAVPCTVTVSVTPE